MTPDTLRVALALTRADSVFTGRTYAAYRCVYTKSSILWLCVVEGLRPDRWDVTGMIVCLIDASLILLAARR